jgi:hypothetical protein
LKLVQERAGNTLEALGIGKYFLSRTQVAQQLRKWINKWDYMKLNRFCTTKDMVFQLKRPPIQWEKIFDSYTSDKVLVTRIDRELKKLNSQKTNDPKKEWATEPKRTFSKEVVQMPKKHMKKCSPPLAIKETQIHTKIPSLHGIATIKNTTNNKCWQGCRKKKPSYNAGGNVN